MSKAPAQPPRPPLSARTKQGLDPSRPVLGGSPAPSVVQTPLDANGAVLTAMNWINNDITRSNADAAGKRYDANPLDRRILEALDGRKGAVAQVDTRVTPLQLQAAAPGGNSGLGLPVSVNNGQPPQQGQLGNNGGANASPPPAAAVVARPPQPVILPAAQQQPAGPVYQAPVYQAPVYQAPVYQAQPWGIWWTSPAPQQPAPAPAPAPRFVAPPVQQPQRQPAGPAPQPPVMQLVNTVDIQAEVLLKGSIAALNRHFLDTARYDRGMRNIMINEGFLRYDPSIEADIRAGRLLECTYPIPAGNQQTNPETYSVFYQTSPDFLRRNTYTTGPLQGQPDIAGMKRFLDNALRQPEAMRNNQLQGNITALPADWRVVREGNNYYRVPFFLEQNAQYGNAQGTAHGTHRHFKRNNHDINYIERLCSNDTRAAMFIHNAQGQQMLVKDHVELDFKNAKVERFGEWLAPQLEIAGIQGINQTRLPGLYLDDVVKHAADRLAVPMGNGANYQARDERHFSNSNNPQLFGMNSRNMVEFIRDHSHSPKMHISMNTESRVLLKERTRYTADGRADFSTFMMRCREELHHYQNQADPRDRIAQHTAVHNIGMGGR